ncbi:MAG: ATP-binding protein [Anaerolineales bacterium]|nr:MAG: ATP-binding protein [Anaerolineales bacterium]
MSITKREAKTILTSLSAGVVPRTGLRHISVGRLSEVAALKSDLDHNREGGATVRFVIGRFGSGKSFLLQLMRTYALESKFVVADADFSPERRLFGSGDEAIATYRELMKNLSAQTRPDGNALPTIIERWISGIQTSVATESGLDHGSPEFVSQVKSRILSTLNDMQELIHGFDFGSVLAAYYQGYAENNEELKSSALRWMRGEYGTKTEAYAALKIRTIIDSDNFYDYLKVFAIFFRKIGYSGFTVCLDEAAYLYTITNSVSRKNNYEAILSIINDCLQGKAAHIGFIFGGTPEFLEDQRRGLFSYEALRSRLASNRFLGEGLQDFTGPVIKLSSLTAEEIFVLLQKIREIHQSQAAAPVKMTDQDIHAYMEETLRRMGAREFTTPRELVREFVNLSNLLDQYPEKTWQEIVMGLPAPKEDQPQDVSISNDEDPLDRFSDFKVN